MLKKLFLLFFFALTIGEIFAQDPQITQFDQSVMYLNPAFTGTTGKFRYHGLQRLQWLAIDSYYNTTIASFDFNAQKLRSGFGLSLMYDQAGSANINASNIGGYYSFFVPIRTWVLRLGLQANYVSRGADFSNKLVFPSQVLQNSAPVWEGKNGQSTSFWDFSTGLVIYNRNFWFGASLHHLSQPNQSIIGSSSALAMKISAHVGANIEIKRSQGNLYILPSVLFKQQGAMSQLDISTRFGIENFPIIFGVSYRGLPILPSLKGLNQDALAGIVGFQMGNLYMGYSYDFTISSLAPYSGGSHEITITYQHGSYPEDVICPLFFKGRKSHNFRRN